MTEFEDVLSICIEEPILRWMQWISRRVIDGAAVRH